MTYYFTSGAAYHHFMHQMVAEQQNNKDIDWLHNITTSWLHTRIRGGENWKNFI
jgi:hypothetical protein